MRKLVNLRRYPPPDVETIADALAAIAAARAPSATIVLTVPRMLTAEKLAPGLRDRRHALNALIRERFRAVDVAAAFEEEEKFFDADGLHLSKSGYGRIAKLVLPACKEMTKSKKTKPRTC